jgi:hypothetical protein
VDPYVEYLLVHVPHMNEVLQQPDLGPHTRGPKEFQETTVLQNGNGARFILGNSIIFFMLSFTPFQNHGDSQMPTQEP